MQLIKRHPGLADKHKYSSSNGQNQCSERFNLPFCMMSDVNRLGGDERVDLMCHVLAALVEGFGANTAALLESLIDKLSR